MPFGLRSATLAVSYILNKEGILVDVYIDDFYGAATRELADLSFDRMTQLFTELRLQSSPDKDTPPTHEMTCLDVYLLYLVFLSRSLSSYHSVVNYLGIITHINRSFGTSLAFLQHYNVYLDFHNHLHVCMRSLFLVAFF